MIGSIFRAISFSFLQKKLCRSQLISSLSNFQTSVSCSVTSSGRIVLLRDNFLISGWMKISSLLNSKNGNNFFHFFISVSSSEFQEKYLQFQFVDWLLGFIKLCIILYFTHFLKSRHFVFSKSKQVKIFLLNLAEKHFTEIT